MGARLGAILRSMLRGLDASAMFARRVRPVFQVAARSEWEAIGDDMRAAMRQWDTMVRP